MTNHLIPCLVPWIQGGRCFETRTFRRLGSICSRGVPALATRSSRSIINSISIVSLFLSFLPILTLVHSIFKSTTTHSNKSAMHFKTLFGSLALVGLAASSPIESRNNGGSSSGSGSGASSSYGSNIDGVILNCTLTSPQNSASNADCPTRNRRFDARAPRGRFLPSRSPDVQCWCICKRRLVSDEEAAYLAYDSVC